MKKTRYVLQFGMNHAHKSKKLFLNHWTCVYSDVHDSLEAFSEDIMKLFDDEWTCIHPQLFPFYMPDCDMINYEDIHWMDFVSTRREKKEPQNNK